MKFSPQISLLFQAIFLLILGLFVHSIWTLWEYYSAAILYVIVMLLLLILFTWIYFSTRYYLSNDGFIYHSGPFKGEIPLTAIRKVTENSNLLYTGFKIALGAKNGLIIHYNKHDEIFISPADKKGFIERILAINPEIIIESEN